MLNNHALVWVDTKKAHIYRFNAEDVLQERIYAYSPFRKIDHKTGIVGDGHASLDHTFVAQLEDALQGSQEWLLVGPGIAKNQIKSHIDVHAPALAARLVGVEAMDDPTAGELLQQARRLFQVIDKMRPGPTKPPDES
jgi:hypothetical protein